MYACEYIMYFRDCTLMEGNWLVEQFFVFTVPVSYVGCMTRTLFVSMHKQ